MSGIYLRSTDGYLVMDRQPFESEEVLQLLIAQHPEMLSSDDASPGALLLVRREAPVQQELDSTLFLDHLYLDARGIPTLVEVKQGASSEVRRKVVAQMLDYAANARRSFGVDRIKTWLEARATADGTTPEALLSDTLGVEEPDVYWGEVASNIETEQLRLVFVSDDIPPGLRRIIEFLNGQMTRTEVLAIEVKQYSDGDGVHQTIVPRVIGDSEAARQTKHSAGGQKPLTEEGLLATLGQQSQASAQAASAILKWGAAQPALALRWRRETADLGLPGRQPIVRIWKDGRLEVRLQTLRGKDIGWDAERCNALIDQLETIDGLTFEEGRKWPKAPIGSLDSEDKTASFLGALTLVVDELGAGS